MSDKTAQLGIVVDPTGVEAGVNKAKNSLASIGATAEKVGEQASKGLDKVGTGSDKASREIARTTQSMRRDIERQISLLTAGERGTRAYYEALAQQRGVKFADLAPQLAQLDELQRKQRAVNTAMVGANSVLSATGQTAKQTTAALRQVPAQFTDIVVSLQSGQNPLTVLLQQGGQLKDVFGGVGAAARALGGYVVGLVNPLTAAAGAIAAVAAGAYAGNREIAGINRTLILTGNQAAVTAGYIAGLASSIDEVAGTRGRATEVLLALSSTGKVGAENLQRFATAAIQLERVGGPAAEETAKAFAELGKAPLQASLKLNEATGYLTKSVYEQIRALEDQGRGVEAARVAQEAYAAEAESQIPRLAKEVGALERAWRGVKDATAEAWDALSIRPDLPQQRAAMIVAELEGLQKRRVQSQGYAGFSAQPSAYEQQLERELASLRKVIAAEEGTAKARREQVRQAAAIEAADRELERLGINRLSLAEQEAALRRVLVDGRKDEATIAKAVAALRERNTKAAPRGKTDELRGLEVDLGAVERDLRQLTGAYADAEAVLAAQRQAGLIDEQDYYEARRAFIRLNTEAQVRALQAENAAIQSSIDGGKLRAEERTRQGEKVKDNVAQIQALEAKAAAQTGILAAQQTSAINGVSRAYAQAQQAAQDYLDALARAGDRELQMLGLGDRARERLQGRQAQEDRFDSERRRIENERSLLSKQQGNRLDPAQEQRYKDELAINEEYRAKALQQYEQDVDKRLAAEGRWQTGASRAMQNYLEEAQNISAQTARLFENAFRGMEDSLVEFVKTGKLDFKSLADSIVADLARIIVKQQLSKAIGLVGGGAEGDILSAAFGAFFGGGGTPTVPGRAIGGPVSAGQLYRVNERKPELLQVAGQQYLMMGNQGGQVKPEAGSGPATVNNWNLSFAIPPGANRATAQQTAREAARTLQVAIARGA